MEGGDRQRAGAALRGAHDAVTAGRQALVRGEPVRQLVGEEGFPLLAAVLLPVGVEAPRPAGGTGYIPSNGPSTTGVQWEWLKTTATAPGAS